jgi:recombination protein RecA
MGDSHVGLQARLMSQAMRKLTAVLSRSRCALVFINQIREKIGVMFGNPETTPGGRALKFYTSVRIDIRRIGALKNADLTIGSRARATVVKNKIAPPFRKTEFDILFNEGISWTGDLIDLGVQHNVLEKSGTWFSFGETRLGQGRERVREFLKENPEVGQEVEKKVRVAMGLDEPVEKAADSSAPAAADAAEEAPKASSQAAAAGGESENSNSRVPETAGAKRS